jgi:hypothetical protein
MSSYAIASETGEQRENFWGGRRSVRWCLFAFTIFYFTDVCLRASAKYFWYDEILTVYFARFSSLSQIWGALHSGIESNLPAFHLLTRTSEAIFGENLVGTRMPEIVSFWVVCLCLFYFVSRRAGSVGGLTAMMLPMLTGAYFYAYEARPLIILVALGSMALLCWDNAIGLRRSVQAHSRRWLIAFSFCLLAALMLHPYGTLLMIPFALVELYRTLKSRRLDPGVWLSLTLPLIPTLFLYPPMARFFRAVAEGTDFLQYFPPNWPAVLKVYSFLFAPCLGILLLFLALVAYHRNSGRVDTQSGCRVKFSREDTFLCIGFAALPAFGIILGQIGHTPYFERYFLSAVLGLCIPFGVVAGTIRSGRYRIPILLVVIAGALLLNFGRIARHRLTGSGEALREPSSNKELATTVGKPLVRHPLIEHQASKGVEPIAVLSPIEFFYLLHYAPELASRLYYVHSSSRDEAFRVYDAFCRWSPEKYNPPLTGVQLARQFRKFYIYSDVYNPGIGSFQMISRLANIQSFWSSGEYFLASMQTK